MKIENGTSRILTLFIVCFMLVGAAGCQNGKCKSCLFDRNKEAIDEGARGQVKQDPPPPPTADEAARLNQGQLAGNVATPANSIALAPTPTNSGLVAQATAPAPTSNAMIPNAASSPDAASRQPSLGTIPDANNQARKYSESAASAAASGFSAGSTVPPQYQSVAPVIKDAPETRDNGRLGFAPSSQDHSAALAPEVKNNADPFPPAPNTSASPQLTSDATSATLPNELIAPVPATNSGQDPRTTIPPAESTSAPEPAPQDSTQDSTTYTSKFRDQYANELAVVTKEPVTLKGKAQARYIENSASAATSIARQPSARPGVPQTTAPQYSALTPSQANRDQFVPNGATSQIAPGVQLGVIDLTQGED